MSPAFSQHIFWPSLPKKVKTSTRKNPLFPACASTRAWRERSIANKSRHLQLSSTAVNLEAPRNRVYRKHHPHRHHQTSLILIYLTSDVTDKPGTTACKSKPAAANRKCRQTDRSNQKREQKRTKTTNSWFYGI